MKPRTLGIIIGIVVLIALGFILIPLPQPIIELRPETLFSIGGFQVTNTILTGWIMTILIAVVCILGTRNLQMIPRGWFQNGFEAFVEGFGNLVNNVAGEKNGRRFFPVVFVIFFYILVANWAALLPIFNVIGATENLGEEIHHEAQAHPDEALSESEKINGWVMKTSGNFSWIPVAQKAKFISITFEPGTTNAQKAQILDHTLEQKLGEPLGEDRTFGAIKPYLRGVNTDVNSPLSYALWSAIFVEFWGITALGFFRYGSKFLNLGRLLKGDIMNGLIDVFVGILEFVSELSRLISFTFRLFGNISAGEILLFMMSFLVPFVLVDVFYAMELFFGMIQAFIFAMLTLVFGVMAASGHGDHEEHGAEHAEAAHGPAHA